jgi:hypothetical protein
MIDHHSSEAALRIRAVYLWERDGRPEGKLPEYFPRAQAMLDEEAALTAPIDEATAARGLLTQPLANKPNGK